MINAQAIKDLNRHQIETIFVLAAGFAVAGLLVALCAGVAIAAWVGVGVASIVGGFLGAGAICFGAWRIALALLDVRALGVRAVSAIIEYQEALTDKVRAEADALSGADTFINQTVNAASGSKVKAQVSAPSVRIRGKQVSWNQLNQLQHTPNKARRLVIPGLDVDWISEQLASGYPHSRSKWLGKELPNSRLTINLDIYNAFIQALVAQGYIVGRDDRTAGKLVERNHTALARAMDPKGQGLVIDLTPAPALPPTG
jgi:hypothetical protein